MTMKRLAVADMAITLVSSRPLARSLDIMMFIARLKQPVFVTGADTATFRDLFHQRQHRHGSEQRTFRPCAVS